MAKDPRIWLGLCMLLAGNALADRVILNDGRVLSGTVSSDGPQITIQMSYGSLTVPRSEVSRIERLPAPQAAISERLARVRPGDASALHDLAAWAAAQGLDDEARGLYEQVLALEPDHAAARRALGFVRAAGQWMEVISAIEFTAACLNAGAVGADLPATLDALAACVADGNPQRRRVAELQAQLLVRQGLFARAAEAYRRLAREAGDDPRLGAIAEILAEHPAGLYVLAEPYPAAALLLAHPGPRLPAGAASLAEPLVLQAALRDRAKVRLSAGAALLEQAKAAEASEPENARRTYLLSMHEFEAADALVPDIARGYEIEVARRRIALLRKDADAEAARFDEELAGLGQRSLPSQTYADKVVRMMRSLRLIDASLDEILAVAQPYSRELLLEIRWAELDKQNILAKLETLTQEFHETR